VKNTIAADSIYNGANDDAAGTTAVIMLANYFEIKNERTIIFTAFVAEEIGGTDRIFQTIKSRPSDEAMFNLEMIGTDSKIIRLTSLVLRNLLWELFYKKT
jgi:Zn-dependent M28 family amino/carboxypeptidase